jgi:hypothetical protein
MDTQDKVKGKLQEYIIAENKQTTNKQTKMIGKGNYEQKILGLRNKIL